MKQKSEAGYTLILVLLTITLIFIFSLTIISNVLNSATQNKKTELDIQKNNISNMAVIYAEKAIMEDSKATKQTILESVLSNLLTLHLPNNLDEIIETKYKTNFTTFHTLENNNYKFELNCHVKDITVTNTKQGLNLNVNINTTISYTVIPSIKINDTYSKLAPITNEIEISESLISLLK